MKKMLSSISVSLLLAAMLTGCGGTAKNTVHNQDDLKNKTIGTQLGTTGYILASDIEGAKVEAKVVRNGKGKKITVFKYRPKKGSASKKGHRQPYTAVQIEKISV